MQYRAMLAATSLIFAVPAFAENDAVDAAIDSYPSIAVAALYETEEVAVDAPLKMTPRLAGLFAAEEKRMEALGHPIGRLDFDWVVNGQDALIENVEIQTQMVWGQAPGEPSRMIVTARFTNFSNEMTLHYFWEKQAEGWALDDVMSRSEELSWTLSLLLAYGQ